jgi:hypothetical protein
MKRAVLNVVVAPLSVAILATAWIAAGRPSPVLRRQSRHGFGGAHPCNRLHVARRADSIDFSGAGDNDILDWFRRQVDEAGGGNYQTLINEALQGFILQKQEPLESTLRRVVRDEIRRAG